METKRLQFTVTAVSNRGTASSHFGADSSNCPKWLLLSRVIKYGITLRFQWKILCFAPRKREKSLRKVIALRSPTLITHLLLLQYYSYEFQSDYIMLPL
jgi:hypothetical protein